MGEARTSEHKPGPEKPLSAHHGTYAHMGPGKLPPACRGGPEKLLSAHPGA